MYVRPCLCQHAHQQAYMLLHVHIAAGMLGLFIGHCLAFSSLSVHSLLLMHTVLSGTAQTADACKVGLASGKSLAAVMA